MEEKIKLVVLDDIRTNIQLNLPRIIISKNSNESRRPENVYLDMPSGGKYSFNLKIISYYLVIQENAYWEHFFNFNIFFVY